DGIRALIVTGVLTCALPIYGVVVEVVGAAVIASAGAHVLEIGRDLAARDARVVGYDDRPGHELGLELPEVLEVVRLLGVDEREEIGRASCRERGKEASGGGL